MFLFCVENFRGFHGGGVFMFIVPLLIIGLIALLIWSLVKKPNIKNDNTSIDVLKTRLAKGEITVEEYEEIKRHLQ